MMTPKMPHIPKTVAPCTEPDRPVMHDKALGLLPTWKERREKESEIKKKANQTVKRFIFTTCLLGRKEEKSRRMQSTQTWLKPNCSELNALSWIWINNLTAEICAYVRCVLHRVGNEIWSLISSLSVEMSPTIWLIAMTFSIHLITTWWLSTECCRLHPPTHKTDSMLAFHTACALLQ